MKPTLDWLYTYLDSLQDRADLDELVAKLGSIDLTADDIAVGIRFADKCYARNLIKAGSWYNVLILCWRNGQRSPIHDHTGSSCAVRVIRGTATETAFEFAPNGQILATGSRQHRPGAVIGSQDADIHQISNLQPGNADLVTMHIYTPPLMWMGTYSLTDGTRGQEPMFLEFSEAAGI
jgi:cysteine dioxygenase